MVEKIPVNINWQTLFMIIPIINLRAMYRIEKLRLFLLVVIALAVLEFLGGTLIFGDVWTDYYLGEADTEGHDGYSSAVILVEIGISIVLVRKWTKEWNEQIKSKNS